MVYASAGSGIAVSLCSVSSGGEAAYRYTLDATGGRQSRNDVWRPKPDLISWLVALQVQSADIA
jgi:hypothetical protein